MAINPKLSEVATIQSVFDIENFSGADTPEGKRRHILLHLNKLLGKFGGLEEKVDHGNTDTTILRDEIIPDLIVYAAQLADLENVDLSEAYQNRLMQVSERNGTGPESVQRAFQSVTDL